MRGGAEQNARRTTHDAPSLQEVLPGSEGALSRGKIVSREKALSRKVFDALGALDNLGENIGLLKEITDLFLEKAPQQIQKMKEAFSCGDASLLERHAHTLKGGSSSIGAGKFSDEAFRLELAARGGDMDKCGLLLEQVEREMENLQTALSGFNWKSLQQLFP